MFHECTIVTRILVTYYAVEWPDCFSLFSLPRPIIIFSHRSRRTVAGSIHSGCYQVVIRGDYLKYLWLVADLRCRYFCRWHLWIIEVYLSACSSCLMDFFNPPPSAPLTHNRVYFCKFSSTTCCASLSSIIQPIFLNRSFCKYYHSLVSWASGPLACRINIYFIIILIFPSTVLQVYFPTCQEVVGILVASSPASFPVRRLFSMFWL